MCKCWPRLRKPRPPKPQSLLESNFVSKYSTVANLDIFNLSLPSFTPTALESTVLGLGPKFLPQSVRSHSTIISNLNSDINRLHRSISLALYFSVTPVPDTTTPLSEFIPPRTSTWSPPPSIPVDNYISQLKDRVLHSVQSKKYYNSDARIIHQTTKSLRNNPNIVIKPADKNLGLCILSRDHYLSLCNQHLHNTNVYQLIPTLQYNSNQIYAKLRKILTNHNLLKITSTDYSTSLSNSLLQHQHDSKLRISPFYVLPKVHKISSGPLTGRPIISAPGSITYYTSKFLANLLQPVVNKISHICYSSRQVVNSIESKKIAVFNDDWILTADVSSLYPSIPIQLGIKYVMQTLREFNYLLQYHSLIEDLLTFILNNNYCTFNNNIYLQVNGTAMGTPVAPPYANLFLYQHEKRMLLDFKIYFRYIDDIWAVATKIGTAWQFVQTFNTPIESLQLGDYAISKSGVFLDLDTSISDNNIVYKLYQKPSNKYSYILFLSNHKRHIFTNFILQELKRYTLYCSYTADSAHFINLFHQRLIKRGYDSETFNSALSKLPDRAILLDNLMHPSTKVEHITTPTFILQSPELSYNFPSRAN